MPLTSGTLKVEGLANLQRHFAQIDKELPRDLKAGLRASAEPVKDTAEALTSQRIKPGRVKWYQMRIGVTRSLVYMVPKQRGRLARGNPALKRPNLARVVTPLMVQALNLNAGRVRSSAQRAINGSIDRWGRG